MAHESGPSNQEMARQAAEVYLAERKEWMADAVGIYSSDRDRNHDPLEVFPEPGAVRADAPVPVLIPGQEYALREIIGRFGIGGEADVLSGADYQIDEGGKPRKVDAEAKLNRGARVVMFAGSAASAKFRPTYDDEIDYMQERLKPGVPVGKTEYDRVRQIAEWQEGFIPLEEPEIMPYGYGDRQSGYALIRKPTGQFIKIGTKHGAEVWHLRVDGEPYFDDKQQKEKLRNPSSDDLMGVVSAMLSAEGDETSTVGFNTSNTYASRVVDSVKAGLKHGRIFHVGMYGRKTLAAVEGKPEPEPTELQHIPGELYVMQTKLVELEEAIKSRA